MTDMVNCARAFLTDQGMRPDLVDWVLAQPECSVRALALAGGWGGDGLTALGRLGVSLRDDLGLPGDRHQRSALSCTCERCRAADIRRRTQHW